MVPLQPMKILDKLFGTITIDFITDLLESNEYDSLHIVIDRFTKTVVIIPYQKSINSDGIAKILFKNN